MLSQQTRPCSKVHPHFNYTWYLGILSPGHEYDKERDSYELFQELREWSLKRMS